VGLVKLCYTRGSSEAMLHPWIHAGYIHPWVHAGYTSPGICWVYTTLVYTILPGTPWYTHPAPSSWAYCSTDTCCGEEARGAQGRRNSWVGGPLPAQNFKSVRD